MHVLHVVQLYHPVASGSVRYFVEIGAQLAYEGHHVTVLTTDAYDLEHFWARGKRRIDIREEMHEGVQIVRLPVRRLPSPALVYPIIRRLMVELSRAPGSAPLLRRLAQLTPQLPSLPAFLTKYANTPFDLIHTTNITLDFAILPVFAFARRHNIPFICTPFVHLGEPDKPALVRYYSMRHQLDLLRASDRVIVQTRLEGDFLAARGVPRERMRQIGVGVTPAELAGGDGARFRAEQRIAGPLALYIGALAYDKGAMHVVEAMQRLWAQGSNATLALIGAPLEQFMRFYKQLPEATRSNIRLLPYAPDQTKRDALAAANVLAMPSRTDSFGIVFLEAWCYGLPVVGAYAGGVPDVVDDGVNGILTPFGDIPAIARAIQTLIEDTKTAARLGAAGQAKVLRELTWDHKYAAVRAAYDEVIRQST
jgi:glycosyltransferase involved in cell wall biosynthesis